MRHDPLGEMDHTGAGAAYKLRLKRQMLLWRALRARHALDRISDRSAVIGRNDILLFATMRNEALRLPYFLDHYRALGVTHFLIVANDSTDGTLDQLREARDVSVWQTAGSYRDARFGMDWINWLLMRHGSGHWCLTVDADELFVYPDHHTRKLAELTRWLDRTGARAMGAVMLDMYPEGPLSAARYDPGDDPIKALPYFDADGYTWEYQPKYRNISIRGGPRKRVFFHHTPEHAPHLHKLPLVRWHWRYAYVSSMHIALPRKLNTALDIRNSLPSGALLHTKFLDGALDRAAEEQHRGEHFTHRERYDSYYSGILQDPVLKYSGSRRYTGTDDLLRTGIIRRGLW